jgi:hypothetical protein
MRCSEVRRLLVMEDAVGYDQGRAKGLRRHLRRCGFCREEAAVLESEARLLRTVFTTPPLRPDFTQEILSRIGAGQT